MLAGQPARPPASRAATQGALLTGKPLARFGVVSFYNPRLMYLKYQPLMDYLSAHTPWRFELALSASYRETVDRLCRGDLQLAYLGPLTHLRARQQCGARAVLRLNTRGRDTYSAYIMVRQHSLIRDLGDLRGRRIAFGAVLSTSSHLVPRAMLLDAGLRPGRDVRCRYYAHHERAARAVLLDEADACGVRDLVGDQFKSRGLRVIAESPPIPNFSLSFAPSSSPELLAAIRDALVDRPARLPAADQPFRHMDEELSGGFAPTSDAAYAPVAALAARVLGDGAFTRPVDTLMCVPER